MNNLIKYILQLPSKAWKASVSFVKNFRRGDGRTRFIMLARLTLYTAAFFLVIGSLTFAAVALSLPDPNKINSRNVAQSTKIWDREGKVLLYEIHGEEKRTLIELDDLPPYVTEATISIEEKDFYRNRGIDLKGILRALYNNIVGGDLTSEGGSTITQQFVKNAILTKDKTLIRKIKEAVLAIELEQKFSKEEILKLYLNEIPYGRNAYGIEAASQTYFNKPARDISLAEAAYLAALPQAPSFFNPMGPNRDRLETRKNLVLQKMLEQGYISEDNMNKAKNETVAFSKIKDSILAPHFVFYVENLLAQKYGEKTLEEGGLNVITTLDWNKQQIADKAVKDGAARNVKSNRAENAALVAIDPKTGQILAMVGSKDYFSEDIDGNVNVAVRQRQPGSSIKPYVYATAFKKGMAPASTIVDVKTVFGTYGGQDYSPSNYNGQSNGPISMRKALAGSLNVPAVKVLAMTGIQDSIDTMKDMGITSDLNTDRCGLSLVLGGCEITLLDHTASMGVFANMGVRQEKTPILKITDSHGKILDEYRESRGQEVLDPQVAYEIVSIMSDNDARSYVFGSRSPLILPDRIVAAKTGTTQLWKDGWTIGYTPSLAAGVWTGNNNSSPMRAGADGVVTAGPIWNQFMREALKGSPPEQFQAPPGIQEVFVDTVSGKLPTQYSPSTRKDIFASFAIPKDFDDVHVAVKINKLNGKRATNQTPTELMETRVYSALHSEFPDRPNWELPVIAWAKAAGYNYPPTEYDDGSVNPEFAKTQVKFNSPVNNQEIKTLPFNASVDVSSAGDIEYVELELEGNFVSRIHNAPYDFTINSANNGWQTLTAIVRLRNGEMIQNSIRINITSQSASKTNTVAEDTARVLGIIKKNKK